VIIVNNIIHEQYISELFQSHYGINLLKIPEEGGKKGKTPDFEYCENGRRIFVCELKVFEKMKPSVDRGYEIWETPNGFIWGKKGSNAYNRISKDIAEAYKQLEIYDEVKILIILNLAPVLYFIDLEDIIRGHGVQEFDNGTIIQDIYVKRASEGRIKNIKRKIDLYIWIHKKENEISFLPITEEGLKITQKYFSGKIAVTS